MSDLPLTGRILGRFEIGVCLGAGGMGEVYQATDKILKREVALKRLAPHLREDREYHQRFLKEAERAAQLTSPFVAGLYDVIEEEGELFLVMEYVQGQTLRRRLTDALSIQDSLHIAGQCA